MKRFQTILLVIVALSLLSSSCKNTKSSAESESADNTKSKEQMKEDNTTESEVPSVIVDPTFQPSKPDQFNLLSASCEGDDLILLVQYGGGCKDHEWAVKTNGAYAKSLPPQITLHIEHNSNNDMCRALLTDTLKFNLTPIRYPGNGELIVKIANFEKTRINYKYNLKK